MRADCIGDADAPDQQRRQADQGENCVKRSTLRSSCGVALLRVRTSQPASGNVVLFFFFFNGRDRTIARTAVRQAQPVHPAHQASWLNEFACLQCRIADQQTWPEFDFRRSTCRARRSAARNSIVALPIVMRSPTFRSSRVSSAG